MKERIVLTEFEERELQLRQRQRPRGRRLAPGPGRAGQMEDARRSKVILSLAAGRGIRGTAAALACSTSYVQRWADRFRAERLPGLVAHHPGRAPAKDAGRLEASILKWTQRGDGAVATPWTTRQLAAKLGTTHMTVARVWRRHGLQPHRGREQSPATEAPAP